MRTDKGRAQQVALALFNLGLFAANFLLAVVPPVAQAASGENGGPIVSEGGEPGNGSNAQAGRGKGWRAWDLGMEAGQEFFRLDEPYALSGLYLVAPYHALLVLLVTVAVATAGTSFFLAKDVRPPNRLVFCLLIAIQVAGLGAPLWGTIGN